MYQVVFSSTPPNLFLHSQNPQKKILSQETPQKQPSFSFGVCVFHVGSTGRLFPPLTRSKEDSKELLDREAREAKKTMETMKVPCLRWQKLPKCWAKWFQEFCWAECKKCFWKTKCHVQQETMFDVFWYVGGGACVKGMMTDVFS